MCSVRRPAYPLHIDTVVSPIYFFQFWRFVTQESRLVTGSELAALRPGRGLGT
jgi:hypothetical protein